jgi:hypothetical protein
MKQNDINIRLAEKTEQISDNLDSFKEESGRALCSVVEVLEIINKIIDYERRMQHRTNIIYAVAIVLTNIALILAILKGAI